MKKIKDASIEAILLFLLLCLFVAPIIISQLTTINYPGDGTSIASATSTHDSSR